MLDAEPAPDKALRAFRRTTRPQFDHPVAVRAQEAAGRQFFLARRLFTLATDIVDDAGADVDAAGRALAVGCVLCRLGVLQADIAQSVIDAMPVDEWEVLHGARNFAHGALNVFLDASHSAS